MRLPRRVWQVAPVLTWVLLTAAASPARAQTDRYEWLESPGSPRVRDWLASEAARTRDVLRPDALSDSLNALLARFPDSPSLQAPIQAGDRTFYFEPSGGEPQPVVYVQDARAALRVLLDANSLSRDGSMLLRRGWPSPDGRYFAYGIMQSGAASQEIRLRDAGSAHDTPDTLRGVVPGNIAWTRDGHGFFYVGWKARAAHTGYGAMGAEQVFYHTAGAPQSQDPLIYDRPDHTDATFQVKISSDGEYAVIESRSGESAENRVAFIDLDNPKRPSVRAPVVRLIDDDAATYEFIDSRGSSFLLRTTQGAPYGRVIALDINAPDVSRWRTIVPETFDPLVTAIVLNNRVVAEHVRSSRPSLEIYSLDGSLRGDIPVPGIGTVDHLASYGDDPALYFRFASPIDPPTTFRYDFEQHTTVVYRRPPASSDDFSPFELTQLYFTSSDGTRVPLLIAARRGILLDGTHSVLLTADGALGRLPPIGFDPLVAAWLQMGGVYAVAGIRGGGEEGRAWHDGGARHRKLSAFADYTAAAQFLIDQRYTHAGGLAVIGRGQGALPAAVLTVQHPELLGATIIEDGLLDMLHFDQYTVGWMWRSEYGPPSSDADRAVIAHYDPIDNARPRAYPATLVTTREWNEWIPAVHGQKLVAALQNAQSGPAPILLRTETRALRDPGPASSRARLRDELTLLTRMMAAPR